MAPGKVPKYSSKDRFSRHRITTLGFGMASLSRSVYGLSPPRPDAVSIPRWPVRGAGFPGVSLVRVRGREPTAVRRKDFELSRTRGEVPGGVYWRGG